MKPPSRQNFLAETLKAIEGLPPLVPLGAVSSLCGVCPRTARRWAKEGRLAVLRTAGRGSGRLLVPRGELVRFLSSIAVQPPPGKAPLELVPKVPEGHAAGPHRSRHRAVEGATEYAARSGECG